MDDKSLRETIKNSIWNASSSIISRIGGLIFAIILARFLLPEGFGIYSLVISLAFIFMTFFHNGINETFLRYISEALGKKDIKKANSYFKYLLKIKFLVSLTFSIILILLAYPISYYLFKKPTLFYPIIFSSIYIFIFSFSEFFSILFFAVKKVNFLAIKESISQGSRIIISLIVFATFSSVYFLKGVFAGLIITSIIVLLFVVYYSKKFIPDLYLNFNKDILIKDKKRIFNFLIYTTIGAVLLTVFGYVDIILLGIFVNDPAYLGYYRSAFMIVSSLAGLLTFTYVFLPFFTQTKREKLEVVFNKLFKYTLFLAIPTSLGVMVLSNYIIRIFYGYPYLLATNSLRILSLLIIFSVIPSLFSNLFSALEKPKKYLSLLTSTLLLNTFLNLLFISILSNYSPSWAITGASLATLISWIFYSWGFVFLSKKTLNININFKPIFKSLFSSITMAIILYFMISKIRNANFFSTGLIIFSGVLIYMFLMLITKGINKEDISIFRRFFKTNH